MKIKYFSLVLLILAVLSCGTDDSLTALNIETFPDTVSIAQNSQIKIFIFSNDFNIPRSGMLTISNSSKGSASIIDVNNTPNNPSDDYIQYKAAPNEVGLDSFQYTICNTSGICKTETVNILITSNSNVLFNLESMPYPTLSEYQFFSGNLSNLEPEFGVIPYSLNAALFSDYAKKKRFMWMPNNTKASYISDDIPLNFPVGTILIKNFYYDEVLPNNATQIIETRLMIKKEADWVFANYVWNAEQTEASLDMNGSFVTLDWQNGDEVKSLQYRIPSGSECHTCHKVMEIAQPIGPKPRNLNLVYNYANGPENQLEKLVSLGYLENTLPSAIETMPNYNDTSQSLDLRARAYLDINCAHCHSEETHCAYRPIRLDFSDTDNLTNLGICVDPDTNLGSDLGHIIEPGDPRNSVLHFRLNSTEPSNRMPLLGRSAIHIEGVELIEEWISSLTNTCN